MGEVWLAFRFNPMFFRDAVAPILQTSAVTSPTRSFQSHVLQGCRCAQDVGAIVKKRLRVSIPCSSGMPLRRTVQLLSTTPGRFNPMFFRDAVAPTEGTQEASAEAFQSHVLQGCRCAPGFRKSQQGKGLKGMFAHLWQFSAKSQNLPARCNRNSDGNSLLSLDFGIRPARTGLR